MSTEDKLLHRQVGNYIIKEKIGSGAMGTVYLAVHSNIGKKVAVKVLASHLSNSNTVRDRFTTEAKAISMLDHPNIIEMYDFGVFDDGRMYYIMEYLAGFNLNEILDNGAITFEFISRTILQVCNALDYVHQQGIIHRDLKPGNIFIARKGNSEVVKILDFGVAKLFDYMDGDSSHKTSDGTILGTPAYMSPEQAMGKNQEISHLTDIYAIGVILYRMLTGEVPVGGSNLGEVVTNHILNEVVPPHVRNSLIGSELSNTVMKALSKKPLERFGTAREFAQAFKTAHGIISPSQVFSAASSVSIPGVSNVESETSIDKFPGTGSSQGNNSSAANDWNVPDFSLQDKTDVPSYGSEWGGFNDEHSSVIQPVNTAERETTFSGVQQTTEQKRSFISMVFIIIFTGAVLSVGSYFIFLSDTSDYSLPTHRFFHPVIVGLKKSTPASVLITIDTKPQGAAVTISGKGNSLAGNTPWKLSLEKGVSYTLKTTLKGYKAQTQTKVFTENGHYKMLLIPESSIKVDEKPDRNPSRTNHSQMKKNTKKIKVIDMATLGDGLL
ncbi:MAG: serine/threonine protein kinase [Deltaproteobacteria bacterium]|nr:serine/threonine protein kinase [Deltaproteobacteria bacterium]